MPRRRAAFELPHGGRPALEGGQPPEGEQILVDGNVLGAGQEFFALGGSETTHDGTRLAYAVDLAGDERYALTVTDLGSDATRAPARWVTWSTRA